MSHVRFKNVSLRYPIYGADTRSLKRELFSATTGGKLSRIRGKVQHVDALHDITLDLRNGDKVGLLGHNGAGKSSLLRVTLGVYEPSAGIVDIQGKVSSLLDIGVGIQPNLTGYENIQLRGYIMGFNAKERAAMVRDVEEFSDLGNYLAMPVKTYSSGMQVRMAFAMSTTLEPDILLLDEVIGAGDERFMKKALNRMSNVISKSNILMLASHSNEVIKDFCNKAILLEHGVIQHVGTPEEVIGMYQELQKA